LYHCSPTCQLFAGLTGPPPNVKNEHVICLSFQSSNRKKETPGIIIPLTAGHVKSKPPTNHLDYLLIIYGSFSTRGILPPIAINSPQSQSANVVQGILLWRRQFHTPLLKSQCWLVKNEFCQSKSPLANKFPSWLANFDPKKDQCVSP
jgi:hypothetical protein